MSVSVQPRFERGVREEKGREAVTKTNTSIKNERSSLQIDKEEEERRKGKTPSAFLCFVICYSHLRGLSLLYFLVVGWMVFVFSSPLSSSQGFSGMLISMLASDCIAMPILTSP